MLDCLLLIPNSRGPAYGSLARFAAVEPPVWAGLLATFLLQKGYGVEILDAHALNLSAGQIGQAVADAKPRLAVAVAYGHQPSASTQTMPAARAALQATRQHALWTPTAILGGHPSALPERTLREEPVDVVIEGEGPYTLAALLKAKGDYARVPGLWWWGPHGRPVRNASAPLVRHLDQELPGVAWELLPMGKYQTHGWHAMSQNGERTLFGAIYSSLGCPMHCGFCMIQSPFKSGGQALGFKPDVNTYRMWSPAVIGEQIEKLVKHYGVRNLKFCDEMLVLNRRHVEGLCDEILARGLGDYLNIWGYSRIDSIKWPELLEKMRHAGFRWLAVGVEAADSKVRDGQDKDFSDAQIVKTVRAIQDAGVNVIANYIFGLEGDTLDSMQRTLDLALELRTEWANFYGCMIYPGSRLYADAVRDGKPVSSNWASYAPIGYECIPFAPDGLTPEQVLRFRDTAFLRYFGDPEYLAMIQDKFGQPAVADILAMLAVPIKRKILGQ